MKAKIFKYIFFIVVIILIIISICILYKDSKKNSVEIKTSKLKINIDEELNIGITDFDDINPILSNNRDVQYIDKLVFQSLLDISYDFKIENLLAEEFSKINSTTYIIKVKENIYWHDGINFTAEDVIFTVNYLKNQKNNSIYKENVNIIDKIEKIDDYTIKIELIEENPFFEYNMCFPILASHSYEEETLSSKTKNLIGTGKYRIDNIEEKYISLVLNESEDYKIKKINIILKENAKELYTSFIKNEIDYMITDNIEYEKYIGTMGYNVTQSAYRNYEYLALNNENKILSNKNVRKAINYGIDRKAINYTVYDNKYLISDFPLDYGSYLCREKTFEYDINKAKEILKNDGWEYKNNCWSKANNRLEFKLAVNENDKNRILVAEEIKKQLQEIGINIDIEKLNNNYYNNYIKNKKYDIILTGNIVSYSPILQSYFGENNLSNFKNEEVEEIMKVIINVDEEKVLEEKYFKLMENYKEEIPFISLYFNSLFVLSKTNLKGDLSFNWYNLFYNIENWYKIK